MKTIQELNILMCANMGVNIETYEAYSLTDQFNFRNDNLAVLRLTSKAFKMIANSPAQIKVLKQIEAIKSKYIKK
jgi:hypothetical protein